MIACEDVIGWRERVNNRGTRVILFMTDNDFHFAGDGRVSNECLCVCESVGGGGCVCVLGSGPKFKPDSGNLPSGFSSSASHQSTQL